MVKRILSLLTAAATASTFAQVLPAHAESALPLYPYTLFAASDAAGAITVNSGNVCINGNIATNGTIVTTAQNFNVNGQSAEHAAAEMLYINSRLSQTFFETSSTEVVAGDCVIEDVNIYINDPLDVTGDISLNGNIELNAGLRSLEDITLSGNVENTYNTVVYSQTGDISIESVNVNFSGLIYAPYGDIVIDSQNLNLNNAIIIGQTITITCPNFNANYNPYMGGVIGTESSDNTDPDTVADVALFSVGDYDPATQSIVIDWFTESTPSSFEILESDDNTEYTSVAVVTEGTEYSYPIGDGFDTKYFKVSYTDKDGNVTESIPFYAVRAEDGYKVKLLDSDGDELPDVYESIMGSDPMNADTDNDGLTDYQEILLTGTDPVKYDSVTEGVSDSDADSDGDNISNADEISLGTDPLSADSDDDGLSDYDEVNVHHTDPLNPDTDNDGIADSSEWKIGLDPNNAQTHGIPDGEYSIDQTVAPESAVFSLINTDDSPYDMSVRITTAGCAEDEMTVTESGYSHAIENEMITGQSVDISMPEERTAETMRISFSIRDDQVGNKLNKYTDCEELCGIKRFNVFHFYEGVNMLLPMETSFDTENNVVYTDTTEPGTYCLVDMEYWMDGLGIEPVGAGEPSNGFMTMQGASIGADDTGIQKQRYDGRDYALIESGMITWSEAKAACENMGGHLCTITNVAEQAFIESLISTGTAENYWLGATDEVAEGDWKWITDEPWNYEHWGENQPSNTVVYNRNGEDYLGITTVDSKWAAVNDWNDYRPNDPVVEGYICEWENEDIEGTKYEAFIATRWKTITLDTPLSPDNDTDTDLDTLTDWEEVKNEYLTLKDDGTYELPKFCDVLSATDLYAYAYRFNEKEYYQELLDALNKRVLLVDSDPSLMDSDNDGIDDDEEELYDTIVLNSDSDNDGLVDGIEVINSFDPLDANPDGDSYSDLEEYQNDMDPYHYNLTAEEWAKQFCEGAVRGDFIEDPTLPQLLGQIGGGIAPGLGTISDIRDTIANVSYGHWFMAATSAVGVIPISGDSITSSSKIAKFVSKNIDKSDEIATLLISVSKKFPDDFAKLVPSSSLDEILEAFKSNNHMTHGTYDELALIFRKAGKKIPTITDDLTDLGISFEKISSNSGFWKKLPKERGFDIDDLLKNNLGRTYKTYDHFDEASGIAISVKSIDPMSKSYQIKSKFKGVLNTHARHLMRGESFIKRKIAGKSQQFDISKKCLRLVFPDVPLTNIQKEVLKDFIKDNKGTFDIIITILE